jgi:hypothetical protein
MTTHRASSVKPIAASVGPRAQPNFGGVPGADVTPNHTHELLRPAPRCRRDLAAKGGRGGDPPPRALGLFRYEPKTVHRLVLPWMDVRAGLYLRSADPYRTRVVLKPHDGEVTTVAVYRETPLGYDGPPWQVVVVIAAPPGAVGVTDPRPTTEATSGPSGSRPPSDPEHFPESPGYPTLGCQHPKRAVYSQRDSGRGQPGACPCLLLDRPRIVERPTP